MNKCDILFVFRTEIVPEAAIHEYIRQVSKRGEGLEFKEPQQQRENILSANTFEAFRGAIPVFVEFFKAVELTVVFVSIGHRAPDIVKNFQRFGPSHVAVAADHVAGEKVSLVTDSRTDVFE